MCVRACVSRAWVQSPMTRLAEALAASRASAGGGGGADGGGGGGSSTGLVAIAASAPPGSATGDSAAAARMPPRRPVSWSSRARAGIITGSDEQQHVMATGGGGGAVVDIGLRAYHDAAGGGFGRAVPDAITTGRVSPVLPSSGTASLLPPGPAGDRALRAAGATLLCLRCACAFCVCMYLFVWV